MPKLLIETFEKTIIEYFEKIQSTHFEKDAHSKSDIDNIIFMGLNAIIHIFRITITKYSNTDIAYHYSKQGYYYYLEYIQQLSTVEFQHNLNINDAIIFAYSKTLSATLSELNNNQNINLGNIEFILNNLANISNTLLQKNGTTNISIYIAIIKQHLSPFLYLFSDKKNEKYVNYLFEIVSIDHLDVFYKNVKKLNKSGIDKSEYEITCKLLEYKIDPQVNNILN